MGEWEVVLYARYCK